MNSCYQPDEIRVCHSIAVDEAVAVKELCANINLVDTAFMVAFFSDTYNPQRLSALLADQCKGIPVIGCTGSGLISARGYLDQGIVVAAFSKKSFTILSLERFDLENFRPQVSSTDYETILKKFYESGSTDNNLFALMIVDGMNICSEGLTYYLASLLGNVPLVGGSGGDNFRFNKTGVMHAGQFYKNAALMLLANTKLPVYPFSYHNFTVSDYIAVATKADSFKRTIYEFNGVPAADIYSEFIGIAPEDMDPVVFANHPLCVRYRDNCYVRSIQKVNPDRSITFFCAVEEGLVMRLAKQTDLIKRTTKLFEDIRHNVGTPLSVLTFDCIYTKIALSRSASQSKFHEDIFMKNRCFGFNTYGEQFYSAHLNQTITGIAFGTL